MRIIKKPITKPIGTKTYTMTELKPTKLFSIPVEIGESEFKISGTNYLCVKLQGKWHVLPPRLDAFEKFKILGTATKDEIDFDVDPFVDKNEIDTYSDIGILTDVVFKDYVYDSFDLNTPKQSFYSLLKANEVYFENPFGGKFCNLNSKTLPTKQWQSAQEKVNDKYLIIQKL